LLQLASITATHFCTIHPSESQPLLEIRRRRTDYDRRAFSVAAAGNWNKLPIDIQLSDTSSILRLKTFFFEAAFIYNNSI